MQLKPSSLKQTPGSPAMSSKTRKPAIVWKAKSREGFTLKLLSEMMANFLKFPPFQVTEQGLTMRSMDENREILVDLSMPKEYFTTFKCPKPIYFIVNANHFYRLLKTIKKKDRVTMFITEAHPMQLGICVEQNDEKMDKVTTYININYTQPEDIDCPDGYGSPIIVTSKHFQKLKTLHSIGTEMKITVVGSSLIKFFVNGKNLYSREISIGKDSDDEEDGEEQDLPRRGTSAHDSNAHKHPGDSPRLHQEPGADRPACRRGGGRGHRRLLPRGRQGRILQCGKFQAKEGGGVRKG